MNHFIEKCESCTTVISQCRCPSKDKEVRYSKCEKCKNPTTGTEQKSELTFDEMVKGIEAVQEANKISEGDARLLIVAIAQKAGCKVYESKYMPKGTVFIGVGEMKNSFSIEKNEAPTLQ